MKSKNLTLLTACITIIGQCMAAIPETGKKYYLKNVDSGLYLTLNIGGGEAFIIDYLQASNADFQFEFLPSIIGTEGYYNLATHNRGDYMYMNDWHCSKWGAPDDAKFDIKATKLEDNSYKLSFANKPDHVIGLDNISPGSPVYSDKTEEDYYRWEIIEVQASVPLEIIHLFPPAGATNISVTEEIKVVFNNLISLEENAAASIKNSADQEVAGVKISAERNIVTIAHDPLAPETVYTVTLPAGTVTGYVQAISWSFTTSEAAVLPVDGRAYKIRLDDTETYLTLDRNQQVWLNNEYEEGANQQFVFKQVSDNPVSFVIRDLTGGYLKDGAEGISDFESESVVLGYEIAGIYIRLKNNSNQYLGPYTKIPGSWVHFKGLGELGAVQTWKLIDLNLTSIPAVNKTNQAVQMYSEKGKLMLESIRPVSFGIYNMMGQKVAAGSLSGNRYEISLPAGIYIVKTNQFSKKLIVK
jgi:hypothetical protein